MRIISLKKCDHVIENDISNFKIQHYPEEEIEEFIIKRCEKTLTKNKDYNEIIKKLDEAYEHNDIDTYRNLSETIHIMSEKVCFRIAAKYIQTILNE